MSTWLIIAGALVAGILGAFLGILGLKIFAVWMWVRDR